MPLLCLLALLTLASTSISAQGPTPSFHPGDVVVFQGDSITDGGRWRTGNDFNHIMGQDYAYMIAGKLGAEFPERNLTFINRGISGNRVTDLTRRWQADTIALNPNIVSILIGINDTLFSGSAGQSVDEFKQTYDHLLADTITVLPHVKIVLGEPFLLPVGKHKAPYAAEVAELEEHQRAVKELAAKYHLPLVMYQDVLNSACQRAPADHWSWDGVHPTHAGHWLMMEAWLETVNSFWPNG